MQVVKRSSTKLLSVAAGDTLGDFGVPWRNGRTGVNHGQAPAYSSGEGSRLPATRSVSGKWPVGG